MSLSLQTLCDPSGPPSVLQLLLHLKKKSSLEDMFIDFREEGRERNIDVRERNINQLTPVHSLTRD